MSILSNHLYAFDLNSGCVQVFTNYNPLWNKYSCGSMFAHTADFFLYKGLNFKGEIAEFVLVNFLFLIK